MGFSEEIEELEKQVAAATAAEAEPEPEPDTEVEPVVDTVAEPDEPEATDEEAEEAAVVDEAVVDENPKEEIPDNAFARMRRENAALKRQAAEAQAQAQAYTQAQAQAYNQQFQRTEQVATTEPDQQKDFGNWLVWNNKEVQRELAELRSWHDNAQKKANEQNVWDSAVQKFSSLEAEFKTTVDDYDEVSEFMKNKFIEGVRIDNPFLSQEELSAKVREKVLTRSIQYHQDGLNPVEEIYHSAKEHYGYVAKVEAAADDQRLRPDLNKVSANRKRNAGTAGAAGRGAIPELTREAASKMPVWEFALLSPEEKKRLGA